jgi:hypothetical protein
LCVYVYFLSRCLSLSLSLSLSPPVSSHGPKRMYVKHIPTAHSPICLCGCKCFTVRACVCVCVCVCLCVCCVSMFARGYVLTHIYWSMHVYTGIEPHTRTIKTFMFIHALCHTHVCTRIITQANAHIKHSFQVHPVQPHLYKCA